MTTVHFDLLIPTRNRHDCVRRSLPSLHKAAATVNANIILCDQSLDAFKDPRVTTIHRPDLPGLPAARNVLLAHSTADVVVFIDDDTDLAPDFFSQLTTLVKTEPHISAWGPVIETRPQWIRYLHKLVHVGIFHDPRRLTSGPSDQSSAMLFGCCFAVRRTVAQKIGFDGRRPGYALGEDADFFQRLTNAAKPRHVVRFSKCLHAIHRRDGQDRATNLQRGIAKGAFLRWWARRHGGHNPLTIIHLGMALIAAASGIGAEPGHWRGVLMGLVQADPTHVTKGKPKDSR